MNEFTKYALDIIRNLCESVRLRFEKIEVNINLKMANEYSKLIPIWIFGARDEDIIFIRALILAY